MGDMYHNSFIHLNITEIDIQPDDACDKDFLKVLFYHVDMPVRYMFYAIACLLVYETVNFGAVEY